MAEIKFRAWSGDHGYLYPTNPLSSGFECSSSKEGSDAIFDTLAVMTWDVPVYWHGELQNFVMEQFTGIVDKNGKEIYEGDILFYNLQDHNGTDNFYNQRVTRLGAAFGCEGKFNDESLFWHDLNMIAEQDEELEIIGNIHTNPLLSK